LTGKSRSAQKRFERATAESERSFSLLTKAIVTTILPVIDMDRARNFYQTKLGLTPRGFAGDGNFLFQCGGEANIALIPKPQGTRAEHTALSFEVADVVSEIAEMEDRGVVFESYDLPGLETVDHVCVIGSDRVAWFKDTEGNVLCLHQRVNGPKAL
jgi:predicted enzyme related to lactoylglutathione lyase